MQRDLSAVIAGLGRRTRTATEFVELALREAIISGAVPAGAALRQEELAAAFDTSRMPVREALRQLEAKGLVDFHPHKGAVVAQISPEEARDLCAIRVSLEATAIRLSVPSLERDDFEQAEALIADMDAERDPGRMGELNRRFHMTLYAKAGRPRLLALVDQHLAANDRYLRFQLAALGREHLSQQDHAAMLEACRRRDAEAACRAVTEHITVAEANLLRFLESR